MIKEFKTFAMRGNVLDMAVGIIIGAAFGKIVTSFVNDIFMPPLGLLFGKVDFKNLFVNLSSQSYSSLDELSKAGTPAIKYGLFLNTVIDFVLVAFALLSVDPANQQTAGGTCARNAGRAGDQGMSPLFVHDSGQSDALRSLHFAGVNRGNEQSEPTME